MEKLVTPFAGFPNGTRSLPVPGPLLGSLLAQIDDVSELKCTLRFLWFSAQVKGAPKAVPRGRLESDDVLVKALGSIDEIRRGLAMATARGTLIEAGGSYLLHTPENARAAAGMERQTATSTEARVPREPLAQREHRNVFELYEANIGLLTPMVADQLREAEADYPEEWIADAIREATERNARSWRYVATILERWAQQGRGPREHGESRRHPEKASAAEYLRQRGSAG
ncbi:MAG: DnaD domain protein [Dehalococcoidia bacterium]